MKTSEMNATELYTYYLRQGRMMYRTNRAALDYAKAMMETK